MLSEQLASPMALLLAAGALVLVVACLNVGNLHLARTELRRRELAVRSALGARRAQLIRLVLIDGGLMAAAAGAGAVWLTALLKERAAGLIAFYGQPVAFAIPLDRRVVLVGGDPVPAGSAGDRPAHDMAAAATRRRRFERWNETARAHPA